MLDFTDHIIRKAYCLSLNEYAVLMEVYYLSKNVKYHGWCIKSKDNIGKTLDLHRDTIHKALNVLIEKGLIEKSEVSTLRTTDAWNSIVSERERYAFSIETDDDEIKSIGAGRHTVGKTDTTLSEKPTPPVGKTDTKNIQEEVHINISTKVDTEQVQAHGREDITKLLEFLKTTFGLSDFREPQKKQRQMGKHILSLVDKHGKEKFRAALTNIAKDDFKSKNCNSVVYLYRELKGFPYDKPLLQPQTKSRLAIIS